MNDLPSKQAFIFQIRNLGKIYHRSDHEYNENHSHSERQYCKQK